MEKIYCDGRGNIPSCLNSGRHVSYLKNLRIGTTFELGPAGAAQRVILALGDAGKRASCSIVII